MAWLWRLDKKHQTFSVSSLYNVEFAAFLPSCEWKTSLKQSEDIRFTKRMLIVGSFTLVLFQFDRETNSSQLSVMKRKQMMVSHLCWILETVSCWWCQIFLSGLLTFWSRDGQGENVNNRCCLRINVLLKCMFVDIYWRVNKGEVWFHKHALLCFPSRVQSVIELCQQGAPLCKPSMSGKIWLWKLILSAIETLIYIRQSCHLLITDWWKRKLTSVNLSCLLSSYKLFFPLFNIKLFPVFELWWELVHTLGRLYFPAFSRP